MTVRLHYAGQAFGVDPKYDATSLRDHITRHTDLKRMRLDNGGPEYFDHSAKGETIETSPWVGIIGLADGGEVHIWVVDAMQVAISSDWTEAEEMHSGPDPRAL